MPAFTTEVAITRYELVEGLLNRKGAFPATIEAITIPDMRKTHPDNRKILNPFYGRISKYSHFNAMLGFNYTNSVNRQRERESLEPDFIPEPRRYGHRIIGSYDKDNNPLYTCLVEHNSKYLLECKILTVYTTEYRFDGAPIQRDAFAEYMYDRSNEGARQGTDKVTILRDYYVENLISIVMDGKKIHLID